MSKFKNSLLVLMAFFALCSCSEKQAKLEFNENGEFKILQFTDLHYILHDSRSDIMLERVEEMLNIEKPDLVVLTGDLVYAPPADSAYIDIMSRIAAHNVPFAVAFGNHDDNWDKTNAELYDLMQTLPGCIMPPAEEGRCGDYTLEIYSHDGKKLEEVLYCIDTHGYDYDYKEYMRINASQVDWYYTTSQAYTKQNGGQPVPSMLFLHIPFPEYNDKLPYTGYWGEGVCCPVINSGMFNTILDCGDVKAVFCGHDHNNDYAMDNRGILLAYGRYTGGDTVYNDIPNGARVILLKENSNIFSTWVTLKGGERIDYLEHKR